MSKMIERVALAAWLAYCNVEDGSEPDYDDDGDWKESREQAEDQWRKSPTICTHIGADGFRRCARAAIEAMREPDKAMVDKAWSLIGSNLRYEEAYRHLIDAALSQSGEG